LFSAGCRLTVIAKRSAASASSDSRVWAEIASEVENCRRRKNGWESGEEDCCDSVMLPPSPASTPVTAWTMPVASGQVTLRIHSVLMGSILIVLALDRALGSASG